MELGWDLTRMKTEDSLRLPGVRRAVARSGWAGAPTAAPGTRSSRNASCPSAQPRGGAGGAALQPGRGRRAAAVRRHRHRRRGADHDRHQRVRSRARRRRRARLARADRRRAGHRQVDAAAAGRGALREDGRPGALQLGRGIRAPDQVARRARSVRSGVGGRRRSTSSPRPASSGSSRRSRGCGRPSSSSTRSRRCSR